MRFAIILVRVVSLRIKRDLILQEHELRVQMFMKDLNTAIELIRAHSSLVDQEKYEGL